MITINLKYESTNEFQEFLKPLRTQFSSVYRYSYNRFQDGLSKKEIYHNILKLNNIELIKGRLINDCVDFASIVYEKDKNSNHKSIFGGKSNFILRCKGKLTKEQFLQKRLSSLYFQGETSKKGNRFFNLDFINSKMTFKYNRDKHYVLNLKISKNNLKQLVELQDLCDLNQSKYTVTIDDEMVHISFEPKVHEILDLKPNRYIGIDLNPTNIGVSVVENNSSDLNIIDTKCYDFSEIINSIKKLNKSSNSKESKYLNNKLNHEILDISKRISDTSKHFKCKFIFIEDLNFKQSSNYKSFNRLTKNLWKRNIFISNLEKRSVINGQKIFKVNPVYSSFIGNCMYEYVDSINASIEIGRRGYEYIINKSKKFYPDLRLKSSLTHRWKEKVNELPETWKEFYDLVKNLKISYRVSLEDANPFNVFRKKVRKYSVYQF